MNLPKLFVGIALIGGLGMFASSAPAQSAPLTPSALLPITNAGAAGEVVKVHGRRVRGRHCRRAWHPRRGWHRHPRACRHKYRKRWRPSRKWHDKKGCYFYNGTIHCRFF